jgi:CheY-like chemotaxis protein
VLLVDDNKDALDLLIFILEQEGASVIAVDSANKALDVLTQINPDILISDIGMPDTDGYTLLHQIQVTLVEQGRPILPAIALTAYAGDVNECQALAAGFQRYFQKPVDPKKLVEAIAQITNRKILD